MTAASWVNSAALGEGCLASAGAWARTSRAGPYSPAATARTPTQSHRRALRTKLVNDMVLSPLSWALDRWMGGCPPGDILVEDRAPGPCDRSGANESMNSFRASVPPTAARNAVLPISCGHIDRGIGWYLRRRNARAFILNNIGSVTSAPTSGPPRPPEWDSRL